VLAEVLRELAARHFQRRRSMPVDQAARRFRFGIGEIGGRLAFVSQFERRLRLY